MKKIESMPIRRFLFLKKFFYVFFKKDRMINCREAADSLYEYLDKELPYPDYVKIKMHLDLCRACCRKFEFEEIVRSIIRDKSKSRKIPPSLKEKILRDIKSME